MGKNFFSAFGLCLFIASLPLACGDDEDDGGGGKGGKGGTNTGGAAGSGTGGRTGGTGGTGGAGGRGGSAGGGGRGGTAGAGGMTGGTSGAGMGGEGGMGGDDGGMGGEGGVVEPPMSPCERACNAAEAATDCSAQANCLGTCEDSYDYHTDPSTCVDEMDALWNCTPTAPAASWSCNGTTMEPQFDFDSACNDELMAALAAGCI